MIKYYSGDLMWLFGFLVANWYFIYTQATSTQFFVLDFVALITMLGIGRLQYELNSIKQTRRNKKCKNKKILKM